MKGNILKIGLTFTFIFVIVKQILFLGHWQHQDFGDTIKFSVLLLGLLLAIFFGVRNAKIEEDKDKDVFLQHYKYGLGSGVVFALFCSIYVWLYYSFIDAEFMIVKLDEFTNLALEVDFEALLEASPEVKDLSKEDFIQSKVDMAKTWYAPRMQSIMTLMSLTGGALLLTVLITVLEIKVFKRFLK